ncbi:MAG: nicotinate phosphoribosyltransferase [Ktedonobacterales bacterium]
MLGDDQFLDDSESGIWYDPGLWTDLYHPDAAFVAWSAGRNPRVTFDLLVREAPFGSAYMVAAGIQAALRFISGFHYGERSLATLRRLGYPEDYLQDLATLRFTGDVAAVPEGRLVFPGEPLLRVTGPFREALLVESGVLHAVNTATLIATKAARVVQAAAGRPVAEFGFRRAQAPLVAAYAARLAGCASTSFLAAASAFGIPASGTIPHAVVELFDDEEAAFRAVARAHLQFRLLLDTYDTLRATETAVRVGKWARETLGHELAAVRLDSGDLAALSRRVRAILDEGGFPGTQVIASGDLDEWKITELVSGGAPIDAFGVGTAVVDGLGSVEHQAQGGAIGGVYKLAWVAAEKGHASHAAIKVAGSKSTVPGIKMVARAPDFSHDLILLDSEPLPAGFSALLQPAIVSGIVSASFAGDSIDNASGRVKADLAALPAQWRSLDALATPFPVRYSPRLRTLLDQVTARAATSASEVE